MKHYGYFHKTTGKLQCESFTTALAALKAKGVAIVLQCEEFKEKRSNPQNRYYHGVVVELVRRGLKDLGWEPKACSAEAVHEMLKREYLTVDEHVKDGVFLKRTRSTTELDTAEFSQYLEHCKQFAAENLGVLIPDPNEQLTMAA
mgnify:FL=1